MRDFFNSLKSRKLTLEQWVGIKYFVWFVINVFFVVRNYILLDVFIINLVMVFGHLCTRIHSYGEGMIMGLTRVEQDKKIENIMMPQIFDKALSNNLS